MKTELLKNKVVVITGGAGLVGKELVKGVCENGGVAIIADVSEQQAQIVKECLNGVDSSFKIETSQIDITSKNSIENLIEELLKKYGHIDGIVNAAYPANKKYGAKFEDVTYESFCENVNLHLGGYFLTSQQFGLYFKKQGFGSVINIASIYGITPPRFEIYGETEMTMPVEYAAIKSAIVFLTKYMAKYFKGTNVRFNCFAPGGVYSGQPENFVKKYNENCLSKGMLNTEDLVGTMVYLLSDMSTYVNGQTVIVDDGFCL